ncbi:zinc-binding metallopeptidase family protein [Paraburkholderia phenazinium]|nr:putative zinc-binding metallopeptidase [Paraburkholderia phenazinium]
MRTFNCNRCEQLVFYENVRCERCEALLGYVPELGELSAFEDASDGRWRSLHPRANGALYRQCHNYAVENVCNWMIPADQPDTLCRSCQFTRTIPNLAAPDNRLYWYRLEVAKRRLLYTLTALGIKVASRHDDPQTGLEFEFLEENPDGGKVLTGHDNGLITLNIAEADDAYRERTRTAMHEPYRTLLGHFRHETGHYYFDRLVAGTPWLEPFRALFGDESVDYAEALETYYRDGAPADWTQSYVSAYATMHPWEDWAETWAHYLLIVDVLDTATSYGVALIPRDPGGPTLTDQTPVEDASFDNLMKRWFPLTYALNSLNRSLGMADGYPFTLAPLVIEKLRLVHKVIAAQPAGQAGAQPMSQAETAAALVPGADASLTATPNPTPDGSPEPAPAPTPDTTAVSTPAAPSAPAVDSTNVTES